MTRAFEHLVHHAHSLHEFEDMSGSERIQAMVRRLGTASSGQQAVILAALDLLPEAWVEDALEAAGLLSSIQPFRLNDLGLLDGQNTRAVVEAIAIQADHPEVVG